MVYHSAWNGFEEQQLLGCGFYAIKQSSKHSVGPAPKMDPVVVNPETNEETPQEDILDEILYNFKANMLFRSFPVDGAGDRLALILTQYIHTCLKRLVGVKKDQAKNTMIILGMETFSAPTESGFLYASFYPAPKDAQEVEKWREYVKQLRMEMGFRVVRKVYAFPEEDQTGNKYWMQFARATFLNQGTVK